MAWYSSASGHLGVLAQSVNPDGSPSGAATTMPNTSDMQVGMLARTPLVARRGGGLYVAYPTGYPSSNRIRLWRIGASRAPLIGRVAGGSPAVSIAAADDGRLWVLWTKGFGDPDVLATRSNRGRRGGGRPRQLQHRHDVHRGDLLSAAPARADAAGSTGQGAEGPADAGAVHRRRRRYTRQRGAGEGRRQVRDHEQRRARDAVSELP